MQRLIGWMFPPKPKLLGPIEPGHIKTSLRHNERKNEADIMPWQFPESFHAFRWIQAGKALPQVGRSRLGGIR